MPKLPSDPAGRAALVTGGLLLAAAAWAYLPTVAGLADTWDRDPNYSHGWLIPILAAGLAWFRLKGEPLPAVRPDFWWGCGLLAVATAARAAGAYFYVTPLDHLALLLTLPALVLLTGGRGWLRRVWPALALLVFTVPVPGSLGGTEMTGVLQGFATRASTFALQTFGLVAYREGNVIVTRSGDLGVVEACSGLRMLMVFCALAVVTAVLLPIGWVRKVVLVASAVPLALACNVIRITTAGLAGDALGSDAGYFVFHDLAGWLMVPLAFVFLAAEIVLLSKLVRQTDPAPARVAAPPAPGPRVGVGAAG
ncbi:MAG: exosortase/archaeosortase family protein [Gemmataceae bacterium]|nr:exosortase/archaeosortase family protein [Gemmataceae bacterium]